MLLGEAISIDPAALFAGIAVVLTAAGAVAIKLMRASKNSPTRQPPTAQWVADALKQSQGQIANNAQAIASLVAHTEEQGKRIDRFEEKIEKRFDKADEKMDSILLATGGGRKP